MSQGLGGQKKRPSRFEERAPRPGQRVARLRWLAAALLWAVLLATSAFAQQPPTLNFPLPEFSKGQTFPPQIHPLPRPGWLDYVDMSLLFLALVAATYFSLRRRARGPLVMLTLFSVAYFGFFRRGCVCPIGALQNVAFALGGNAYQLPLVIAVFFGLPLLFALFVGRVYCASVCPLGALQELFLLRPVRVPAWLDSVLSLLPYLFLGVGGLYASLGSAFLICRYDPFIEFFRLGGTWPMLLLGAGLLLLGIFVGRPYCRYICPLSVLLRMAATLAQWRPRITTTACHNCHLCTMACPYGAIRVPTAHDMPFDRRAARRALAAHLLLLPLFIGGGGALMRLGSEALAQPDPRVQLAKEVWQQEHGQLREPTPRLEAFGNLGQPNAVAYQQGAAVQRRFDRGSWLLGGWLGLIFGVRLTGLLVRRRREHYVIEVAACVQCGRCYNICPFTRTKEASAEAAEATPASIPLQK